MNRIAQNIYETGESEFFFFKSCDQNSKSSLIEESQENTVKSYEINKVTIVC